MTEIKRSPADYLAETIAAYIRENAELRADNERLLAVLFKKCDKGHGWLTAANWVEHECLFCQIERLNAVLKDNMMPGRPDTRNMSDRGAPMMMVEKVARAMWAQRRKFAGLVPIKLEDWGDGTIPLANGIFEEAVAAIEAMREPTDEMRRSATSQGYIDSLGDAGFVWQAMIDAALNPNTGETK